MLPMERITQYRYATFRHDAARRVDSPQQAAELVRERGFIYFWPISGVLMPSLWAAVVGDRPVPNEHDDPGHVTWGWKDAALGGREWYYAKVLRKKATLISFEALPYFYALSENYGAYEEDYLTLYEQGRLTLEARTVYETLLERGPLDTIELRRAARLAGPGSDGRFNKALADLQANFNLVPVGVSDAGAWHYAFIYDIAARRYPELPDLAHAIDEKSARQALAGYYLRSVGGCGLRELMRLFGWRLPAVQGALDGLAQAGVARLGVAVEGQKEPWAVLSEL